MHLFVSTDQLRDLGGSPFSSVAAVAAASVYGSMLARVREPLSVPVTGRAKSVSP
jgi:hypothetical protein